MSDITFLGTMPDPFKKADGTRMTPEEWQVYRGQLREKIVKMEFGTIPPRPEVVRVEQLNTLCRNVHGTWYKIFAGTKEKQVSFLLELNVPFVPGLGPEDQDAPFTEEEKYPVVLTGDACYANMETDVIREAMSRGYIAARFNRLELANDVKGCREGGLYSVYTDVDMTAIGAWAWGYMVCMDVFEKMSFVDETEVGITGHSRGGKTVLLAAAIDERIKYVCPNNSGAGGAVSYRCVVENQGEFNRRTERLGDLLDAFPTWMGTELVAYRDREQELPYDMHYFGALIAPRYYLQCEGMQDYWINPMGAWQNFMAVKECYRYLGCEEHAGAWFRPGFHRHKLPDYQQFLDFMDRARLGKPLSEHLQINPYPGMEKNFQW